MGRLTKVTKKQVEAIQVDAAKEKQSVVPIIPALEILARAILELDKKLDS
jgi:hypothetical protein